MHIIDRIRVFFSSTPADIIWIVRRGDRRLDGMIGIFRHRSRAVELLQDLLHDDIEWHTTIDENDQVCWIADLTDEWVRLDAYTVDRME